MCNPFHATTLHPPLVQTAPLCASNGSNFVTDCRKVSTAIGDRLRRSMQLCLTDPPCVGAVSRPINVKAGKWTVVLALNWQFVIDNNGINTYTASLPWKEGRP